MNTDNTQDAAEPSPASAGSQPVAWLAIATDGSESSAVYMAQEQAQAAADQWGWSIAPLYATPPTHATPGEGTSQGGCTLTAAEREALEVAVEYVGSAYSVEHHAKTIRAMLGRLS